MNTFTTKQAVVHLILTTKKNATVAKHAASPT